MNKLSIETMIAAVNEFHVAAKQPEPSYTPSLETQQLRYIIMTEEVGEMLTAETKVKRLDALADQLYVLLGTAIAYDLYDVLAEAFWRVHEANMAKFGPGSQTRADGKVLKPPGWQPPDLSDLV